MLKKLLTLLDEGRAYSGQELSEILGVSMDTVLAEMAYLERLGLLRRISIGGDCAGVCKSCSSACKPQWSHPFVMWEKPVKSNP